MASPKLTPVDGDPFASPSAPRTPKLTPVDGDPFANAAPPPPPQRSIDFTALRARSMLPVPQPDTEQQPTAAGAFARHAGRQVAPTLAGAAGFGAGFAGAGVVATPLEAVPFAGPVLHGAAAVGGGIAGAFGAGYLVDKAQNWVLKHLPDRVVKALGQDEAQRQADETQHPIASFTGGLAPSLITMKPSFSAIRNIPEDASLLTRAFSHPVASHVIGATLGGASEAANEATSGQKFSPTKIGIATAAGSVLNAPTEVGDRLFTAGGNTAIRAMQAGANVVGRVRDAAADRNYDARAAAAQPARLPPRGLPAPQLTPVDGDPFAPAARAPEPETPPPAPPAAALPTGGALKLVPVEGDPFNSPPASAPAPASPPAAPQPVATASPAAAGSSDGLGQAAPLRPEPGPVAEGERLVRTPAGASVRTRMGVVDASQLHQAEGANQNRDRSRDTTDLQVQDIISKFDPELLHEDPSSDRGAPIVGPDLAIDSGNGRAMALQRIYDAHPELADKYRAMIEGRGFDTTGMDRPVLVQHRMTDMTPEQRRQFVIDSNKDTKLELSPVERARSDADAITPEMLAKYAGGDLNSTANAGFVQDFNKRLTAGEMGNMIGSDRRLTTAGQQRIENAVVAHAYGNPRLLERMMESSHDDIRSITGSLADVAGPWGRLRQAAKAGEIDPAYDITDQLTDAAARIADARKRGIKPHDILAQQDAFDQIHPVAAELIRAFHNPAMTRSASRKSVSTFLQDYIDEASAQKATPGLFGEEPAKPPAEILKGMLEARDNPNGAGLALDQKDQANVAANDHAPAGDEGRARGRAGASENHDAAPAVDRHSEQSEGRAHSGRRLLDQKDQTDASTRTPGRNEGRDARQHPQGQEEAAPGEGRPAEEGRGGIGRTAERPAGRPEAPARSGRRERGTDGVEDGAPDYSAGRDRSVQHDARPYDPDFNTASFTNRTSIFNDAAEALGMDPDHFTLLPAPRQVRLLQDAMAAKYGVAIIVDHAVQERFAIDQMLDAYRNVQGMAHVLDLPERAVSLGGKLKLKLQKGGNFLGAFQPGANLIMLPRRSNSFAHEWGHALDWHLLGLADGGDGPGRGLTGAIRQRGTGVENDQLPATVREAFVDLLNSMFFDKAGVAQKIMQLEAKAAQSNSARVKAEAQTAIDKLRAGNSQVRDIRTAFYNNAKTFDGPGGDYWQSPTEMFARAFEAYVSYKAEAAGLTTEFLGKGDAGYLSNAEERFAKTFPKGEERSRIFASFEQVFGHIADEQILANGKGAEKPTGSTRPLTAHDKSPKVAKERGIIRREISSMKAELRQREKEIANRPEDAKGAVEKSVDVAMALVGSMAGNMRVIQARTGSPSLQTLIDDLTKQDGKGDRTVTRAFSEDVHMQSKRAINRLENILKSNGIPIIGRRPSDDMVLRDLLIGAINPDGTPGPFAPEGYEGYHNAPPAEFVKAAAAIRHLLDEEFYVNQRAGIDLGYTRSGYLARVLDLPKVYHDQAGFTRQAAKVYELVFDKAFGDPDAVLNDEEALARFMKLARSLAKKGHDIPSLEAVRAILKKIRKADAAAAAAKKAGEDSGDAEGKLAEHTEALGEAFGELWDEVRPAFAKERAEAWLAKINLHAGEERNASSPDSKYTKHRELPPEADKLMEKFYLSDPIESVTNYLNTSARRTAYARRFGADGAKRKKLFEGMAAEGVSPDDQMTIARQLDIATGRARSNLGRSVQETLSAVNAWGTMALLPRATISSLAEPFTAGLVTGDLRDGFKMMGMTIGVALGAPAGRARYELARAIGIFTDIGGSEIMMARFGQTFADQTRWERYTEEMFRATGLTHLTRWQKGAGVGLGHAYLDNLSNQILATGKWASKQKADNATALLRELGIRDPEAFAKEIVVERGGKLPSLEDLDTPFGHDYATAQLRFSTMVIQEPTAMDRPELAHNPVGRVLYAITGFSMGYWRNIIRRNGVLLKEKGKRSKLNAGLYASGLVAAAATAFLMNLTVSTIRERLLNPKRWHDLEQSGQLNSQMAQLAFTRTFSFGMADPAIQAFSGLKYQRDLSNAFVGPAVGFALQNFQKVIKPIAQNSRKNNSAEFNAMQGIYSNISPFLGFALAKLPGGGPLMSIAKGAGMGYLTSSAFRDNVASTVVGPKNGSLAPDGSKVQSGPTGYDRLLDKAFGPVVPKSRQ